MSVSLSKYRVIFQYLNQTIKFKTSILEDSFWHTIGISVAGKTVAMTTDCLNVTNKKIERDFPTLLSVKNNTFRIGKCDSDRSLYQASSPGMLKDVIFVPEADAASQACPPRPQPNYELDNNIPMIPGKQMFGNPFRKKIIVFFFFPDIPIKSYWPRGSICTWMDVGNLAFDVYSQKLKVCVNGIWQEVEVDADRHRLDYVIEYQMIPLDSPSIDVEIFHLPGEGMFAAFANNGIVHEGQDPTGYSSILYWNDGKFKFYQKLETDSAQSWEFFTIGNQFFLAVANYGTSNSNSTYSTIFRWHRRRKKFKKHQKILTWTARDFEYFQIDGEHYLAVANHAKGDENEVESCIYQWNKISRLFEEYQKITTTGAYDWTYFKVDGFHFLAVANAFNGLTTLFFSILYFWQGGQFVQFQTMETNGATDWEWFVIENDMYLGVANAFNYGPQNFQDIDTHYTNSTIYKLNTEKRVFEKYQSIPTYSAIDWEYFGIGSDHYIIVSNAQNGGTFEQHTSIIYRWQGMDRFVPVHKMATPPTTDWEIFTQNKDVYLIYANANDNTSQVLKVKFL
ncbi:hypothetical protein LOTGIDRAFT_140648 [Lottia gigantea]|uniref:Laminin G domain-containing protein n=1 Tax=Lottia gigantea TaxID=225164 RepID=V4B2R3_LOTGI|nr:hypothetical protein LOTGIDRAFT_140648 [Lottia gigantea]ESP00777.1 hypothetical protein LOTGIDRAFT_140648 [Lottia gigantea]